MIKNMKSRVITAFIIFIMLMATLVSYNSYAVIGLPEGDHVENTDKEISSDKDNRTQISYRDLKDNWYYLCTQNGTHIPSANNTTHAYVYKKNSDGTESRTNEVAISDLQSHASEKIYYGKKYESEEIAYYAKESKEICTPELAYILNHVEKGKSSYGTTQNPTEIQKAWWFTDANLGKKVEGEEKNEIATIASNYQEFVKSIAKNSDDVSNPETYKTYKHTYSDGTEVSVQFPEIDTSKLSDKLSFKADNDKAPVLYDAKNRKYEIGPFTLNYVQSSCNNVEFGSITDFKIYTDVSNEPVSNDNWRFVGVEKEIKEGEFPESGDKFYIELDYIEGATKITKIDAKYKFLIAGAEYDKLEGTYDRYEWVLKKGFPVETSKDSSGNYTQYNYTLEAKKQGLSLESQKLALFKNAANWYETISLSFGDFDLLGSLQIKKIALDENGNELTADQVKELLGEYQYFNFDVNVVYPDGTIDHRIVPVRAGETVIAGTYAWDSSENSAPTYKVVELPVDENSGWKIVKTENAEGVLSAGETSTVTATGINQLTGPNVRRFEINKTVSGKADHDETFKFRITVKHENSSLLVDGKNVGDTYQEVVTITVPKGKTTGQGYSKEFKWYGKNNNPTYEIEEIKTDDSEKYNSTINPKSGKLKSKGTSATIDLPIDVLNYEKGPNDHVGSFTIKKELEEGYTDDIYTFDVHVEGAKNTENGKSDFTVNLKADEVGGPYTYVWEGDKAPTVTVTETNLEENEVKKVSINVSGLKNKVDKTDTSVKFDLEENETAEIEAKFVNKVTEHKGNIEVIKDFCSTEKMTSEELKKLVEDLNTQVSFDIKVTIAGTFMYNDKVYQNTTAVVPLTLSKDNEWRATITDIHWWGPNAPTYTVEETASNNCDFKYDHFYCTDAENSATNTEGHKLIDNKTVEYTVYNRIPSSEEIDLTFSMAGIAWIDQALDSKNDANKGYYKEANGVYDEGETLKDNVEVTVYKVVYDASGNIVSREPATAYKDIQNNVVNFPVVTATDGAWNVARMPVPAVTEEQAEAGYRADYDVEFVYDGQTYEPTKFLSCKSYKDMEMTSGSNNQEKAKDYMNATKKEKKGYEKDSMAIESLTEEQKGNVITKVSGKTEINANGDTTGIVTLANGEPAEVQYTSSDAGVAYPTHSTLKTTDENGRVLDLFKASATTSAGYLTFPFNIDSYDRSSLTDQDVEFSANGFTESYKFYAVYDYCLHINLGLVQRDSVDIGLTKNLTTAKVVVKEKMYQYNYSGLFDLTEVKKESLNQDIYVEGENAGKNIEYTLGLYKSDYYYRAAMYKNGSDTSMYDTLNTFYKSIGGTGNDPIKDTEMDVYLTYKIKLLNTAGYDVTINSLDDYYESNLELIKAEESKYLKTQTGVMDASGTIHKEETVNNTVKVADAADYADKWNVVKSGIVGSDGVTYNKMTANDLGIKLGSGESTELTLTYKVNKKDSDKAKEAIVLGQKCNVAEIGSYSVFKAGKNEYAGKIDRDSAPANVNISNYNDKKWYEDDTFAAPRINVNINTVQTSRNINGNVWEDDSNKDTSKQENPGYNQYIGNGVKDGGEDAIKDLTTELVEKVAVKNTDGTYTEYEYIWPTDKALECLNNNTMESLIGLDTTTTTNNKGEYSFNDVITGDYVVKFTYGDKAGMQTASYSTAEQYNGQDFKSSKFNSNLTDGNVLKADSYLDVTKLLNVDNDKDIKNTAVDSEVRRLEVIAKSRELNYDKTSKMANYDASIFGEKGYQMFAETPKISMNIENQNYDAKNNTRVDYNINNVSFGLEERPITELSLDKQIEEIILTTSDGRNIMDAKYNIDYEAKDDGNVEAKVELDTANSYGTDNLQAINRDEATNNGYRYINIDSSILEGATITVKYRFTVLNTGEVDRTGKLAEMDYTQDEKTFQKACDKLSKELATFDKDFKNNKVFGEYVGNIYYYGKDDKQNGAEDSVVSSTVRQLVDYVDNDMTFSGTLNASTDTSWSNITTQELLDNNYIDPTIKGENGIVDKNGIKYETDDRTNLIVSVDSNDDSNIVNNKGFVVALKPEYATRTTNEKYQAAINLTVSKVISATDDDLQIDNIAEIIRYNNQVGRRDELTIAGNVKPQTDNTIKEPTFITKLGSLTRKLFISEGMTYAERDTSATEVVTLSPPTGSGLMIWKLQVLGTITASLAIVAGGIILIKKKVLKS